MACTQNKIHPSQPPWLVVSDGCGRLFEIPGLFAIGKQGNTPVLPELEQWIPLPKGSLLMELPDRVPIGYDPKEKTFISIPEYRGKKVWPASAFLVPGYTQLYYTAYASLPQAVRLPLYAYTPIGWRNGQFWVTAVQVEHELRHDPSQFHEPEVLEKAHQMLLRYPTNRLVKHLVENCVQKYHCPNAQNFVLERWECPAPVSPGCNAQCVGCISEQENTGISPAQYRIAFTPTVEEICEYTIPHLQCAERAMVSFGQGCEGEPLLKAKLIEKAIRHIRKYTRRGTLHVNTNAGYPEEIDRLASAGLESIRVSLNSAQDLYYHRYYRPKDYSFKDVLESLKKARAKNLWISLNYFIFPGFTEDTTETQALLELIQRFRIDCIQMRNLNIDPEWYLQTLQFSQNAPTSTTILQWMVHIRKKAPWIQFRYYNPPKEDWKKMNLVQWLQK